MYIFVNIGYSFNSILQAPKTANWYNFVDHRNVFSLKCY